MEPCDVDKEIDREEESRIFFPNDIEWIHVFFQVLREYTGWVDPTCRKRGPSSGCPRGTRSLTLTGFPVTQTTPTRGRTV